MLIDAILIIPSFDDKCCLAVVTQWIVEQTINKEMFFVRNA